MARLTKAKTRTNAALMKEGFAALIDKLGIVDAIRFVQLHRPGEGDYTQERRAWADSMTMEDVSRLMAATSQNAGPARAPQKRAARAPSPAPRPAHTRKNVS